MTKEQQLSFAERVERDKKLFRSVVLISSLGATHSEGGGPGSCTKDFFDAIDRGEVVDFEVFRGALGVALEPTPWSELVEIVSDGRPEVMARLGRLPLELKRYFNYRDQVIVQQYRSITDYLYAKVFGVPTALGHDGRKVAVVPPDFNNDLRIVWRENDFPYSFEEGVAHHNCWANRPLSEDELKQVIAENRQGYECVHYINPPAIMSVPDLWHAHIISRPARVSQQEGWVS